MAWDKQQIGGGGGKKGDREMKQQTYKWPVTTLEQTAAEPSRSIRDKNPNRFT